LIDSFRKDGDNLKLSISPMPEIEVVNIEQEDRLQLLAHEAFMLSLQKSMNDNFESVV
jgi:hypothetical protein